MEYAAVIIPTLNREKHLRRCVESLKENDYAKYTDLYISVDFPPSEKYRKGYAEVVDYVKTIDGFNSVNLYYQEKNLGPGLNRKFLEEKIAFSHDKYVFTDDDNEFSDDFLEYINWGLEKYKDDDSVYAICSMSFFETVISDKMCDYMMIPAYNPFGAGHWLHKNEKCRAFLNQNMLDDIYKSKAKQERLKKVNEVNYSFVAADTYRILPVLRGRDDSLTYVDIWENIYCVLNDKVCVIPSYDKSRNWGLDGSGVHSLDSEKENYEPDTVFKEENRWCINPTRCNQDDEMQNMISYCNKNRISKKEMIKAKWRFTVNAIVGNRIAYKCHKFLARIYKNTIRYKEQESNNIFYG